MTSPVRNPGPAFYHKAARSDVQEVIVILKLYRATGKGTHILAAQLRVDKNNRVELDCHDEVAKAYLSELRNSGIWSRKRGRAVLMDDDGADFIDAVADSLCNSSYWQAVVDEASTPTDMRVLAARS